MSLGVSNLGRDLGPRDAQRSLDSGRRFRTPKDFLVYLGPVSQTSPVVVGVLGFVEDPDVYLLRNRVRVIVPSPYSCKLFYSDTS